ncbi:MAG: hypothetical protein JST48_02355 [Bacteroidetes bacterium]|nr:hypothetical protein [Bacteroidota bacterium]
MQKILVLFFLFTLSLSVRAQQKDYIITLAGDSIPGELKLISMDKGIDRVQVIFNSKKKTFTALQTKRVVKNGDTYHPVKHETSFKFMKVLKHGYLSLYAFNTTNAQVWDGNYLYKNDGTGMDVPNLGFKKYMSNFLSDCESVKNKIEEGKLGKRNVIEIVEAYNLCIDERTKNILKTVPTDNRETSAIKKLLTEISAENFPTQKDALDILNDIQNKLNKKESVPNYQIEGLKLSLKDKPALLSQAEKLIILLKK